MQLSGNDADTLAETYWQCYCCPAHKKFTKMVEHEHLHKPAEVTDHMQLQSHAIANSAKQDTAKYGVETCRMLCRQPAAAYHVGLYPSRLHVLPNFLHLL